MRQYSGDFFSISTQTFERGRWTGVLRIQTLGILQMDLCFGRLSGFQQSFTQGQLQIHQFWSASDPLTQRGNGRSWLAEIFETQSPEQTSHSVIGLEFRCAPCMLRHLTEPFFELGGMGGLLPLPLCTGKLHLGQSVVGLDIIRIEPNGLAQERQSRIVIVLTGQVYAGPDVS